MTVYMYICCCRFPPTSSSRPAAQTPPQVHLPMTKKIVVAMTAPVDHHSTLKLLPLHPITPTPYISLTPHTTSFTELTHLQASTTKKKRRKKMRREH